MKIAKVTPLLKKGEITDMSNYYRPVSLLSSISKVYERTMNCSRLVNYLDQNDLYDDSQRGFRKHKSVETAAVDLIEMKMFTLTTHSLNVSSPFFFRFSAIF